MTDWINTFALLERLCRHEMMAEARESVEMRSQVATLEATRANLLDKLRTEARIVRLEATPYVGAYIRSIRNEEAQINRTLAKSAPRIEEHETAMLERFRELATVRLAFDHSQTQARTARNWRESSQSDEQILLRWVRRPKPRHAR